MIRFYIHTNQLYNFLILKEPVQLYNNVIDENYFEVYYNPDDLIITTYRTYSTVELKTFRKRLKNLWKRNKQK